MTLEVFVPNKVVEVQKEEIHEEEPTLTGICENRSKKIAFRVSVGPTSLVDQKTGLSIGGRGLFAEADFVEDASIAFKCHPPMLKEAWKTNNPLSFGRRVIACGNTHLMEGRSDCVASFANSVTKTSSNCQLIVNKLKLYDGDEESSIFRASLKVHKGVKKGQEICYYYEL